MFQLFLNSRGMAVKLDPMLAMLGLGGSEVILILGVALLLFGGKSCLNSPRAWARV